MFKNESNDNAGDEKDKRKTQRRDYGSRSCATNREKLVMTRVIPGSTKNFLILTILMVLAKWKSEATKSERQAEPEGDIEGSGTARYDSSWKENAVPPMQCR
jgi:hypothetical protein